MGRYGGDEFLVILIDTDKDKAKFAAGRIREAIEGKDVRVYDENLKVTVSIGISVFPDDSRDVAGLIEKADLALYQAKQTGRNKICAYAK